MAHADAETLRRWPPVPRAPEAEPWAVAGRLARSAQCGDAMALNDLIDLLTPYVSRLCTPIALADSADAVQESLIAVFRNLGQLKDPTALYAWVRTITVREAVRVAKRAARETPVPQIDDFAAASSQELASDVHDVLRRLTEEHRAVLVLRELEGLDERAASAVLNISRGTVKSRLHRARNSFRKAWNR
jgi:RNA polymerase sigma factor (sigma-70 family)